MLTRRLALASNNLLGKQISKVLNTNEKLFPFVSAKGFNAHFYNGKVAETPIEYHSSCKHNHNTKLMCKATLNKWRYSLIRFYSRDPSVKFLSGGKSTYFEDNAVHDNNKFLSKVINQIKEDNGIDVCVIETSEERRKYADYVVVVSGRSTRHLKAMTNHIHQQVLISLRLLSIEAYWPKYFQSLCHNIFICLSLLQIMLLVNLTDINII